APVILPVANTTIVEGQFWSYQVEATDPNPGDAITYSTTGLPASLEINPSTGLISGTIEASADVFTVIVRATDAEGKFDEETFTITVRENLAPSLTAPPDAAVNQGASFSYQIVASDSDPGDALTYSA